MIIHFLLAVLFRAWGKVCVGNPGYNKSHPKSSMLPELRSVSENLISYREEGKYRKAHDNSPEKRLSSFWFGFSNNMYECACNKDKSSDLGEGYKYEKAWGYDRIIYSDGRKIFDELSMSVLANPQKSWSTYEFIDNIKKPEKSPKNNQAQANNFFFECGSGDKAHNFTIA